MVTCLQRIVLKNKENFLFIENFNTDMTDKNDLGDLFVDVTGTEETVTEREEEPSRDPVEADDLKMAEDVASVAEENGLDDAVAGSEADQSAQAPN